MNLSTSKKKKKLEIFDKDSKIMLLLKNIIY